MICALMIGRAGSTGFPGKNVYKILGRPLCAYPLMAASASQYVDRIFVSTDSDEIKKIASQFKAEIIDRPAELATSSTLSDDVFVHGYREIEKRISAERQSIEFLVLLFANAATLTTDFIDQGVSMLRADPSLDGATTTSVYNMYSPIRARKLDQKGRIEPFIPFEAFGDISAINTSRDSQGDVYYTDGSVTVIRPKCLEHVEDGLPPHRWMGRYIGAIPSSAGCDVDYEWQVPMVEFWLRKNGFEQGQI